MVFQGDSTFPWLTVHENVEYGLKMRGVGYRTREQTVTRMLQTVGLAGFAEHYPYQLSGGMRQRVALARTFLSGRPLVLLDEPFASLDQITRGSLQEWLADALRKDPRTVVLVTHDVQEAIYLADRVAIMSPRPGRIVMELKVPIARPRPRRQTVTSADFAHLEGLALDALEAA
jgi:NitT/TauT family transport system ATP-binding protein